MIIEWKKPNIKVVDLQPKTGEKGEKLIPKKDSIKLLPGINEIDDDDWQFAIDHVQDSIEAGFLVEVKVESGEREVNSLLEVEPQDADKLAKQITNPETLLKWLADEPRDSVRLAIKKQLKVLGLDESGTPIRKTNGKE